ncbi:phosphotransferase enzyme family protein [Paenibacillus sp. PL2-23]|uniref:phosphotransferase enzyme family protein n=1 Tax=Paenibacillus sp. PL2-23 TaxID=2100729 RepID=UPI0030F54BFA
MNFPVMYSTFNEEALKQFIQEHYDIPSIMYCRLLMRGMNDTFLVKTPGSKYVFRVYRTPWRSHISEIAFEVELIQHLYRNGVAVSYPIQALNSTYIQTFQAPEGIRYGLLFSYAEGEPLRFETEESAYHYGRSVASLHDKSDMYETKLSRPALDITYLIEEPLGIIQQHMSHRMEDYHFIERVGNMISAKLTEVQHGLDWGICHGDLHGGNAHKTEETITHFDFDICGYGWRAYDLAVFKFAREVEMKTQSEQNDTIWNGFLAGYMSIRTLSQADLDAVPYLCAARQIWLMRLTLHYFRDLDIAGSDEAEAEYFDGEMELFNRLISSWRGKG